LDIRWILYASPQVPVVVDLDDVSNYRANLISARNQAAKSPSIPRVEIDFNITVETMLCPTPVVPVQIMRDVEEIGGLLIDWAVS
jgi:hypothetical protein